MDYPVLVNPGKPLRQVHAEENQDSSFKTASWLKSGQIEACDPQISQA